MKKLTLFIAALLSAAAFTACDKKGEQPENSEFTLCVEAAKAFQTRALELNGKALKSVWASTDVVVVCKGTTAIGELKPQTTGSATTVLKGSITASGLSAGTELLLITPDNNWSYGLQEGDLDQISELYDYATAVVKVTSVSGSTVNTDAAAFENQQAIVKFTITDDKGQSLPVADLRISAAGEKLVKNFKVSGGSYQAVTGDLIIEPLTPKDVYYVALRNDLGAADTYTLTATSGANVYTCTKEGVLFENGKYYAGTVAMKGVEDVYTVAGAPESVFGSYWDATDNNNNMVKQPDGTYLKTYDVKTAGDIAFKVVKDHDWAQAWPTGNYKATVGVGELKISFNPANKTVTATFADPPSVIDRTYTVAGTPASVFGKEWDPSYAANDMVKQPDGNYAKTYSNVPAGTYLKFKVAVDHSWTVSYGQGGGDADVEYTTSKACNLTIKYDVTTNYVTAEEN